MKLRVNILLKISFAILSGLFVSMLFPGHTFPSLGIPYVYAIAFIPLFLIIFNLTGKHYILKGIFYIWIFGFTVQLTAFFWVSQPIIYFTTISTFLGYVLFVFISILSSFYFVILFSPLLFYIWLHKRNSEKGIPWKRNSNTQKHLHIFTLAILITALEVVIPRFFKWSIGQGFNQIYLLQLNSLFGFNTGTFIIILINLSIVYVLMNLKNKSVVLRMVTLVSVIWVGTFLFGFIRINLLTPKIASSPKIRVAFIQPNFTFQELASKRIHARNSHEASLFTVIKMSHEVVEKSLAFDNKLPDLLVWPESVAPDGVFENESLKNIVINLSSTLKVPILVQDIIRKQKHPKDKYWSIWSVSKIISENGMGSDHFEKWVPIPFGETLPLEKTFPKLGELYRKLVQNSSKIEFGTSFDALNVENKFYVAPLICFDSIYQKLPYLQAKYGNADLYINQANFMWMVNSNAGLEFSYLDQARAIENARSMILSSNTGPTMAFDPLGRIIWGPSDIMSSDLGFFDVPLYTGKTLFSYVYNWPILIAALFALYRLARLFRSKSS